jgi:signal transduction histidine kinase
MVSPLEEESRSPVRDTFPSQKQQQSYEKTLYIESEQVKLLYGQAPTSLIVTLLNATILTLTLRDLIDPAIVFSWLGAMVCVTLGRALLIVAYHRVSPSIEQTDRWRRRFILGVACAGIMWGSTGVIMFAHHSLAHQIFLAFVLGGMIIGGAAVLSWVKEAFIVFLVPTALPIIVQFFSQEDNIFIAMGALSAIFIVAILTASFRLHSSVTESLSLRFDKGNLIRNLSFSESQTAAANIALREEIAERKRAEEELRAARDELEIRVQHRTAELVTTNEALQKAKDAAESANRAKGEFLASMSHEVRTPLSIIIGYADLMDEEIFGSLSPEQRTVLKRVKRNAQELFELIAAMLDLSRLEAGRLPVDLRAVMIPELLRDIEDETQEIQEQSGLHFVWNIESNLPPIFTDPVKFKVIIKNLLGNAIRFTKEGSVTIDARVYNGGVEICVTDTGIGIPQDALNLIFEPFQQLNPPTSPEAQGGTGLGLHIVKRLLNVLGGSVTVESEVGKGSIFRIWAPIKKTVASDNKPGTVGGKNDLRRRSEQGA